MNFDNRQFEAGAKTTMSTLDRLKQALSFSGSKKGLTDLQSSVGRFNLGGMGTAVDGVSKKFLALSTVAITALANITNRAVDSGLRLAKSFTIEPVMQGFQEYELNMKSIQTILANTARHGSDLDDVTAALDNLNEYADKTIYNFADMTKNISLFTNAGIKLEDATAMIKGFSNEAAASGTSAEGAASAAYQLSQALSSGIIRLMDWKSLTNVGMGNKNMQDGLIQMASAMGTFNKDTTDAKTTAENFNASLEKGWLTTDVMQNYLKVQAGELSDAQMKSLGLTDKQIASFKKQANTALDAATKVRTGTAFFGTLKEQIGSSFSETFKILIGDFNEGTTLWTSASEGLGKLIGKTNDARNELLQGWKDQGGRDILIEGLSNAFEALLSVLRPVKKAWNDIFPAMTVERLVQLTERFRDFTERLKMGAEGSENLRRTMAGVFAVFDIARKVVSGVIGVIGRLFGAVGIGNGSFLELTGSIGDFLVGVNNAMETGDGFANVLQKIGDFLLIPIRLLQDMNLGLDDLARLAGPTMEKVAGGITEAFSNLEFSAVLEAFQTGLFAGLLLMLRNFLKTFSFDLGAGGLVESISGTFDQLTTSLSAMQTQLKSKTLMSIAAAIALIVASVYLLSSIEPKKLETALKGLGVAMGELLAAFAIIALLGGHVGFIRLPLIGAGLILFAGAILVLSAAVKNLSSLSWDEMLRGLAGVAGLLAAISIAVIPLSANAGGMLRASTSILILSAALTVLVGVVERFADMSWSEMGKGMAGLAGGLTILAVAMWAFPPHMLLQAAALLMVGNAISKLADSIAVIGGLSWKAIGKGMAGIAGGLTLIGIAMYAFPPHMLAQAAALLIVSSALSSLSKTLESMGGMSWEEIAKSLILLGGSLVILAGGLTLMAGSLAGSAALALAAFSLGLLVPILITMGSLSWETIIKGLVGLAASMLVVGGGSALLGMAAPLIAAFGAALLVVGVGMLAFGAGAFLAASALGILAGATIASVQLVKGLIGLIPEFLTAFAKGIAAFATTLAESSGPFLSAMGKLLLQLIDMIIKYTPKVAEMFGTMLEAALRMVVKYAPKITDAGIKLMLALLVGLAKNQDKIVDKATDVVAAFLRAIGKNSNKVQDAAAKMIIDFVNGTAKAIRDNSEAMGEAGANLGKAVASGMLRGIVAGQSSVVSGALDMAANVVNGVRNFLGIHSPSKVFTKIGQYVTQGFSNGLRSTKGVNDGLANLRKLLVDAQKKTNSDVAKAQAKLDKLKARNADPKLIREATKNLKEAEKAQRQASNAIAAYNRSAKGEQKTLFALAKQYDDISAKLKTAQQALVDIQKERDNAIKSYTDQFSTLPDITAGTGVEQYQNDLRKKIAATERFHQTLNQLRAMGLNDTAYEQLLSEGIEIQPYLDRLKAGGKAEINETNALVNQLGTVAGNLGKTAGTELYKAGIQAAQGLVKGLQQEQAAISKAMDNIANSLVKSIKKKLKIKSPSRVLMEVGKFVTQGLANGLKDNTGIVDSASAGLGDTAVAALKDRLGDISALVDGNMDLQPTVRPVIDLTELKKQANGIGGLFDGQTLQAQGSYTAAADISSMAAAIREAWAASETERRESKVEFTQINQSPKALSTSEIYRKTKNQLSLAKEALDIP